MADLTISTQDDGTGLIALVLCLNGVPLHTIQKGYHSDAEAVEALLTALTYAAPDPPDLTGYDVGIEKTTELIGQMEEVMSALMEVGGRLENLESAPAVQLQPVTAAPRRSLLGVARASCVSRPPRASHPPPFAAKP